MDAEDARRRLRTLALQQSFGRDIGSDWLIEAALAGVLAGLDSPALAELAGLTRREEPEALDLFRDVVGELALRVPADPVAARWELVRLRCEQIVDRRLPAHVGGGLIWREGWHELGYPAALTPLVGWVSEWDDWTPDWSVPRDTVTEKIIDAARHLLAGPWPPTAR